MKIATVSLEVGLSKPESKVAGQQTEGHSCDFAGFTEVRSKEMSQGLQAGLAPGMTLLEDGGGESPQAYRHGRWDFVDSEVIDGVAGVSGVTPDLKFLIVTYRNRKNPRKKIRVVSTHFVPLTLHGRPRPDRYDLRVKMWNEQWNVLKQIIARSMSQGVTIFVIGDFNNSRAGNAKIKELNPRAKWIIKGSLDWVFCVEATVKGAVKVVRIGPSTEIWNNPSDHDARARNVWLRVRR